MIKYNCEDAKKITENFMTDKSSKIEDAKKNIEMVREKFRKFKREGKEENEEK